MKKIIYIIFAVFFLSSCDVNVDNPNTFKVDDYWKTEQHARYGINATYNMFNKPSTFSRWLWFRFDLTSDEGFSESPWAELKEWTRFIYNNYEFGEGNVHTYSGCYQAIFRANQVLTYVPNIEFKDEKEKERILGQAYFLRGLYYSVLAELWGSENPSLGIVLEPSSTGMKPQGHTGAEIYEQAIKDMTEAQKLLPEYWDGDDKGRATKGAALAQRAKCYMQLHKWDEAKNDFYWLVEGDGKKYYDLVGDYFYNFDVDHKNNIESVFEIQYSGKNTGGDGDFEIDPNLGLNRSQFFAPPNIGWNDGELRPWLVTELKKEKDINDNYDIRLKYTAYYAGQENDFPNNEKIYGRVSNTKLWEEDGWGGRVFFRKYSTGFYRDFDDYYAPINVRWIRFADVLLMYAECIAESGGDLAAAVAHVDRVRARVDMPKLAVNHPEAATNKDKFLKRLQMERVMELASEGHRWADIKRWGLLDTQAGVDELKSRDADFNNFVIGKNSSLPMPSTEVNNNPNIKQNPKY